MAASDLSYCEYTSDPRYVDFKSIEEHFAAFPIGDWHPLIDNIGDQLISGAKSKLRSVTFMQYNQVNQCRFNIAEHHHFLSQEIKNEQSVQFTYADPIVCMLCRAFDYKLNSKTLLKNQRIPCPVHQHKQGRLSVLHLNKERNQHDSYGF